VVLGEKTRFFGQKRRLGRFLIQKTGFLPKTAFWESKSGFFAKNGDFSPKTAIFRQKRVFWPKNGDLDRSRTCEAIQKHSKRQKNPFFGLNRRF